MLERELKKPPIFLVRGGAALMAAGAGALWIDGEDAGVLAAEVLHNLKPHLALAAFLLGSAGGAD